MPAKPPPLDIADKPELAALVRELLASGQPRELRRGDEVLGVFSPADGEASTAEIMNEDDREAALENAAGSMAGLIDAEAMHRGFAESRRLSVSRRRYP